MRMATNMNIQLQVIPGIGPSVEAPEVADRPPHPCEVSYTAPHTDISPTDNYRSIHWLITLPRCLQCKNHHSPF
jgi:hypothetical protein